MTAQLAQFNQIKLHWESSLTVQLAQSNQISHQISIDIFFSEQAEILIAAALRFKNQLKPASSKTSQHPVKKYLNNAKVTKIQCQSLLNSNTLGFNSLTGASSEWSKQGSSPSVTENIFNLVCLYWVGFFTNLLVLGDMITPKHLHT